MNCLLIDRCGFTKKTQIIEFTEYIQVPVPSRFKPMKPGEELDLTALVETRKIFEYKEKVGSGYADILIYEEVW